MGFTPMPTATLAEDLMGLSIRSARDCVRMHRRSQLYMPPHAGGPVWAYVCLDGEKKDVKSHIGYCSTFRLFVVNIVLL